MSENIHNDDELYRKAYNNFEEEPSPEVWDKLNARLDQKDATLYRAKFTCGSVAVVLIFLLGSALAYEVFFKPGTGLLNSYYKKRGYKTCNRQHVCNRLLLNNQHQNNLPDSLNEVDANAPFSSKQHNRQEHSK